MSHTHRLPVYTFGCFLASAGFILSAQPVQAQTPPPAPAPQTDAAKPAAAAADANDIYVHALHKTKLGPDAFECSLCHVAKEGSVVMQLPGHTQCNVCHQEIWDKAKDSAAKADQKYCAVCHKGGFPPPNAMHALHLEKLGKEAFECNLCHATPGKDAAKGMQRGTHTECNVCHQELFDKKDQKFCATCHQDASPGATDLLKVSIFHKGGRDKAILFEFSHARHVDPKGRVNAKTGFRADCTFCHSFDKQGVFGTFPSHTECSTCHTAKGPKPLLAADSTSKDCQGCHNPEEIEHPGFTKDRRFIAPHVVSGVYVNLKFNHQSHFRSKEKFNLNCTKCHYAIPQSTTLASLTLPKMVDCVECHDNSKSIVAEFRMSKCSTCHVEKTESLVPASHTRNVRPDFHTTAFRRNHEKEAVAPGAKCFVCHQNVTPSGSSNGQCASCHTVMKPVSHSLRWKEDIHGKFASIERESCAACHTSDTCSRCHNQAPASHAPRSLFLAGRHQRLAMLDERACFTCHTFQNTCSRCHINNVKAR